MAGESNEETMATIMTAGFDCIVKAFQLSDGSIVNCYIYDTAGQERFQAIALKALRIVQGVIVVFDLTKKETFKNVINWLNEIKENFDKKISIVLFGNKSDFDKDKWEVTEDEAKQFAEERKLPYFETSAKLNKNINEGFQKVVNDAYDLYEGSNNVVLNNKKKKEGKKC